MFVRSKVVAGITYLQLVESERIDGRPRQRVIGSLGRLDKLRETGAIDFAKAKDQERQDGTWLLVTNADQATMTTMDIALRYKQLWMVEDIFCSMKSLLETRPIWHKHDETIRDHVFCSFLALVVRTELQDRLERAGHGDLEWADVVRGLRGVAEFDLIVSGKTFTVRTNAAGPAAKAITATGVALPPVIRQG